MMHQPIPELEKNMNKFLLLANKCLQSTNKQEWNRTLAHIALHSVAGSLISANSTTDYTGGKDTAKIVRQLQREWLESYFFLWYYWRLSFSHSVIIISLH